MRHLIPIRTKICFSIFLFLNSHFLLAADLSINVKQRGTGSSVEGAVVVLGETEIFAETDKSGHALFTDAVMPLRIKILATGYENMELDIPPEQHHFTVYLEPVEMVGTGIEVTAERLQEKASKISLTKQELTQTAGSMGDPLKAITALPGIISAGEDNTQVYMRGSNTDENIIWVNRAPVGYLYHPAVVC